MIAILEDAIDCFEKYYGARGTNGHRIFREVEEWLMTEPCRPFSFEHICSVLKLDPCAVRRTLLRKQAEHDTALTPRTVKLVHLWR